MIGADVEHLIRLLGKLPGLGPRSARRVALSLLKQRQSLMVPLGQSLLKTADTVLTCGICNKICSSFAVPLEKHGYVMDKDKCHACGMCAQLCPTDNIEIVPADNRSAE